MIPQEITREHVLAVLREIDRTGIPKERQAAEYMVVHGGKLYPEKYVVSLASRFALGKELGPHSFSGGRETVRFLTARGFPIVRMTAWEGAVARLGERHRAVPGEPGLREIVGSKAEVTGKFGRIFSAGHLPVTTGEEFSAFLGYARQRGWIGPRGPGGWQGGDVRVYRERLALLLDESRHVAARVDAFGAVDIASAILHIAHPNKYGVLSRPVEDALRKAGIFPVLREGATPGATYAAVNEVLLALAGATGMDPWTLCAILHALGEGAWAQEPRSLPEAFRDAIAIAGIVQKKGLHGKSLARGP
ncbi:MAG: hypothetical protein QXL43_03985, partial [Methanolinea sp.]